MTREQVALAIELAKEAAELHTLPPVNEEELEQLLLGLIENELGFFLLKGDSIFVGLLCPCLYNSKFLIAQELLWYSRTPSSNGIKVWKEFEVWAEKAGADQIHIPSMCTSPESIKKLFLKKGYRVDNTVMRKDL